MSEADGDPLFAGFAMLASALAGRPLAVAPGKAGDPAWTDGQSIFIDPGASRRAVLESVAVQASLMAAGSFDVQVLKRLSRRSKLVQRYLTIEGHRALLENDDLLPETLRTLADRELASRTDSPQSSVTLAEAKHALAPSPENFGTIRIKKLIAANRRASTEAESEEAQHVPRRTSSDELEEFDDDQIDDSGHPDPFSSPVGGGGLIGKWLKKLLSSARKSGDGGGPPGADAPTSRTNSAKRGAHAVISTARVDPQDTVDVEATGFKYPEWDAGRHHYRPEWCTVREVEPTILASAPQNIDTVIGVRKPLARLGLGLHRLRRQRQGDDIDVDAAVDALVEAAAGSVPHDAVYLETVRRRRDLSVLLLLDISGSAAEPGTLGRTVHQQQLTAAANLTVALHDLGDRVALYAYHSQGRRAVTMIPVKRFDEHLEITFAKRLNSLEPGAYSRLGAAIRHGSAVLEARGGTARRLLVVLSDGLAYDHGYERAYGAADARRALDEARRRGTGSVCLTVGAGTDVSSLRRVFGSAAHATVGQPQQVADVIGPLFRSALRSAEVTRKIA